MHACVAGLKRCGASVVLVVVEVEVEVVVDAVCTRPVDGATRTLANTAITRRFDRRNMDGVSMRGRRTAGRPRVRVMRQKRNIASSWRRVCVGLSTKLDVPWLATHGRSMKFVKYARALTVSGF